MKKLTRVWHPYNKWEEIEFNMWGGVKDEKQWIDKAIEFTGGHARYGSFMVRVTQEWPISCENALTDGFINKKAWVGHAASALAMNCPEYITRRAWKYLTDEQQFLANKQAERAIQTWQDLYFKSQQLCGSVGEPLLF